MNPTPFSKLLHSRLPYLSKYDDGNKPKHQISAGTFHKHEEVCSLESYLESSCCSASFKSISSTLAATPAWWKTELCTKTSLSHPTWCNCTRPYPTHLRWCKPLNQLSQVLTLVLIEDLVSGSRLFLNTLHVLELDLVELKLRLPIAGHTLVVVNCFSANPGII